MNIVKPKRARRTYTQTLSGTPQAVFELMCPVREADWIVGWEPPLVVSVSGVAERDCVFTTSGEPEDSIWYITQHDAASGFIEMIKVCPKVTACRISINVRPTGQGSAAEITYMHTSLGPRGDELVDSFTQESYNAFMRDWENQVNHYLRTGTALRHGGG